MTETVKVNLKHETYTLEHNVDPFYAYLQLTQRLGAGKVFLLDAAAESQHPYNMSLVAANPLVEVQIKDGTAAIAATSFFAAYIAEALGQQGYAPLESQSSMRTVVEGTAAMYQPEDCMAFLEALRRSMRAMFQSQTLQPFSQGFLGYIGYDAVHYLEKLPKTTLDDLALPDIRLQWHGTVIHILEDRLDIFSIEDSVFCETVAFGADMEKTQDLAASWVNQPPVKPASWSGQSAEEPTEETACDSFPQKDRQDDNRSHERDGQDACSRAELGQNACSCEGNGQAPCSCEEDETHQKHPWVSKALKEPPEIQVFEDVAKDAYEHAVERAKEYILAGDIFQVVLSKRIRLPKRIHHYQVYEKLRRLNPSPYMFMAEYPDCRLLGASPEVQFRCVQGSAEMKPIAGTSKGRGKTEAEDKALRDRLLSDEKERAEHLMLVDLCRNDLGRVSLTGSVKVKEFMIVEPYSHLFHLVSTINSQLRPDVSVFRALLSTFPAGTLSGAPKIRAMEIIDELEIYRRGPYGGMIGMVDFDANANTAIVIRTITEVADQYFIQVGAGIVADSIPEQEWQECGHKSGALMAVLLHDSVKAPHV